MKVSALKELLSHLDDDMEVFTTDSLQQLFSVEEASIKLKHKDYDESFFEESELVLDETHKDYLGSRLCYSKILVLRSF